MKRKQILLSSSLILALLISCVSASPQVIHFTPVADLQQQAAASRMVKSALTYYFNVKSIGVDLNNAAKEFTTGQPVILILPLPNGENEAFKMFESPVLAPEIASRHPDIKTYSGEGNSNKGLTVRLSITPLGINAIVLDAKGNASYIERTDLQKSNDIYVVYSSANALPSDETVISRKPICFTDELTEGKKLLDIPTIKLQSIGANIRTFRLAVAATAEFTANHGGTRNLAFFEVLVYVNKLIAIFRRELAISFTLTSDENLVYVDPATDPYTNSDPKKMLDENQYNMTIANPLLFYDIGHVLYFESGGSGIATLESICNNSFQNGYPVKSRGATGMDIPSAKPFLNERIFAHEIGHQMGMTHSFNSKLGSCSSDGQWQAQSATEPGSGFSIMSYSDRCGTDDYAEAINLNFHALNYLQANTIVDGLSCYTSSATGNTPPSIASFTSSKVIPKLTPFLLEGKAVDADAIDLLTYSWEGTNIATTVPNANTLTDPSAPPFFRSYSPKEIGIRYFPRLEAILDGSNVAKGDKLPATTVTTTHQFTVRDGKGGVATQNTTIQIDGNSGPFLITNDFQPFEVVYSCTKREITWSVNNTDKAPVNCTQVDILLSVDGGYTFPYMLARATNNDGGQIVTMPALNEGTEKARIKVKATNSIFFDISNFDFFIRISDECDNILFNMENTAAYETNNFTSIGVGKQGFVWAGTSNQGLYQYNGDQWTKATYNNFLTNVNISNIKSDRDGGIWIAQYGRNGIQATEGGIVYYPGTALNFARLYSTSSTTTTGIPTRNVRAIFINSALNDVEYPKYRVWSAHVSYVNEKTQTVKGGIGRGTNVDTSEATQFKTIRSGIDASAIALGNCQTIAGNEHEVWTFVTGNTGGYNQILCHNTTTEAFIRAFDQTNSILPASFFARAIYYDPKFKQWWVGLQAGGVFVYDVVLNSWKQANATFFPPTNTFINSHAITGDNDGNIYIGSNVGLFSYNGAGKSPDTAQFSLLTVADGLPSSNVRAICVDSVKGRLLIATDNGILFKHLPPPVNAPKIVASMKPGSWHDPSVWSNNTVPGENDNVTINHPVTIVAAASCRSLALIAPGTITVSPGVQFKVLNE